MVKYSIIAVLLAMTLIGPNAVVQGETLEPDRNYTWGINNAKVITIENDQIITEAVLRFHNFTSDVVDSTTVESTRIAYRGGGSTTTTTIVNTPNFESLKIYVLDNPRYGFVTLSDSFSGSDPFAGYGGQVKGVLENNDLVYRLTQTHDQDSHFSQIFDGMVQLPLSNGGVASLSSSLLEFIDYAGTGCSVGFGIMPGGVGYHYDDITLTLTMQSYQGVYSTKTLVFHLADDMIPVEENQEQQPATYTLAVNAANGMVFKSPDKVTYTHGETVTLTAAANTGYTFANWSGDAAGAGSSVNVTMDGDKVVTANFTQNAYTLTIVSANGTVVQSPNKASYTHGETVTLTATANAGYTFANWSGDATGTGSSVTVTMNGNKTVTANYTQNSDGQTYSLSVSAANGAVIMKVNGVETQATVFAAGTVIELVAVPNTGYVFNGWSGSLSGTANPAFITVDSNKSLTANFVATRTSFR